MLCTLLIGGSNDTEPTDFDTAPWNNVSLVTPHHTIRKLWDVSVTCKHCQEKGQQLFMCKAEDTIEGQSLTLAECYGVAN